MWVGYRRWHLGADSGCSLHIAMLFHCMISARVEDAGAGAALLRKLYKLFPFHLVGLIRSRPGPDSGVHIVSDTNGLL